MSFSTVKKCRICSNSDTLVSIHQSDVDQIKLLCKFKYCIPEIVWFDDSLLCTHCLEQLQLSFAFRRKCLQQFQIVDSACICCPFQLIETDQGDVSNDLEDSHPIEQSSCDNAQSTQPSTPDQMLENPCNEAPVPVEKHLNASVIRAKRPKTSPKVRKTPPETFTCFLCEKTFARRNYLAQHLTYHKGARAHMCAFCGKSFVMRNDLLTHEKIHANQRAYECDACAKRFNTHRDVRSHKLVVHSDRSAWKYACAHCAKTFPIKSNLDQHVRRHVGERRFACHLCAKRFVDKGGLRDHVRTHSNMRPFKCTLCAKEYRERRTLAVHLKRVHDVGEAVVRGGRSRRFVCSVCTMSYVDKCKLERHMCKHTGEKPYACHVCDRRFTAKAYVKSHLRSNHNIVDVERL